EFAQRMNDLGDQTVAGVFARLARLEEEHLGALERRTAGLALPPLATHEYRWLAAGAPETAARELVHRLLTPRAALATALGAEKRAQACFEHVLAAAQDPALRALAREMAADEREHVAMIQQLLERTPAGLVDWASVYQVN